MKALLKEEFTNLVNDSRSRRNGQPGVKGHVISLHDDDISNRQEVNLWAQEIGCEVEIYPSHSVVTVVPITVPP